MSTPLPAGPDDPTLSVEAPRGGVRLGEVLAQRFRIVQRLGTGGMGEVFEADDLELGGKVALKTIRPDLLQDAEFLDRFRREVQLARQVTHPNICRLFDLARDEAAGRVFFTMELVEGQTLNRYLGETGPLSPEAALPLATQIARGLAALHERGIVHRDFKPGNVLIAGTRAVITDFGLARAQSLAGDPESRPSGIVGTPEYMAPEQLLGQHAGPEADIYAFGLVLYEMVTGARPFPKGEVTKRLRSQPRLPREIAPGLPEVWEDVILRCLALEPADRPASAVAVVEELRGSAISSLPSQPKPVAPRRWWLHAVAALALVAVGGGWYFTASRAMAPALHVSALTVAGSDDPALRVLASSLTAALTRRTANVKPKADFKVEGTLTPTENGRLRAALQITDTKSKQVTARVTAEEDRINPGALEESLSRQLIAALGSTGRGGAATAASGPGAQEFYLQARGYLQRTDQLTSIDSAIKLASRAIELDPSHSLALATLGEALFAKYELTREAKWMEEALATSRRAVDLAPALPETQVGLGRLLIGTGRAEEALTAFQAAVKADANNVEAHQGLGNAFAELKRDPEAEAAYRRAIALKPGEWTSYKQFGLYYGRRGDWDKAIEQYKVVIELTPDNAHGYNNAGAYYSQKGDWKTARTYWERALALDPTRTGTMSNLAKAHYNMGEYSSATALYERAIKLTTTQSYTMWGNLGLSQWYGGNRKAAESSFREAIRIAESELMVNPNNADPIRRLAFYRAHIGPRETVEPLLARALALAPTNTQVMVSAAETFALLGQPDRAVELARRALRAGHPRANLGESRELRPLLGRIDSN